MELKLHRMDYVQVGLTSKNTLKTVETGFFEGQTTVTAVAGDHSGSIHSFCLRPGTSEVESVFKTLPGPNAKISCLEVVGGTSGSPKILVSYGSLTIRGFTRKGKQFFGLELNNLTEPIQHLKLRWPNEVFICGHYIYNHYLLNADSSAGGEKGTVVQSKDYFVCPEKINAMILLDDKPRRRSVPVLACKDRLLRIIKDSTCNYELETCGIPSDLVNVTNVTQGPECLFCYGTLDGKVSMVGIDFNKSPVAPTHKWEIPEKTGVKAPVQCLASIDSGAELYIGRSDGSVEIWSFSGTVNIEGSESIDVESAPVFLGLYNCGESITSVAVCKNEGSLLLCCTFTGIVFGLTRNENVGQKVNPNYVLITRDTAFKIESLRAECDALEIQLTEEKERYHEMTSGVSVKSGFQLNPEQNIGLSALPYFAINDSFVLQEDACYLLTLEAEVAIDAVIIQSDIPLDLIDCERNSAVVSFNENSGNQVLATFRCQSNTMRLEIKIRSIEGMVFLAKLAPRYFYAIPPEGQHGLLRVYIMTRMSPKSCQVKHYQIRPLSLHKRSYGANQADTKANLNKLTITGNFSLNEAHNWLQLSLPEIPERLMSTNSPSLSYNFLSTFSSTVLICDFAKGSVNFGSENVSTISILKDFITREATKKSIAIEMSLNVSEGSISYTLRKLYPKLKALVRKQKKSRLREAVNEINATDPEIAAIMMEELNTEEDEADGEEVEKMVSTMNLDRLYGLIADLYIDYHKLRGNAQRSNFNNIKTKIDDLVQVILTYASDEYNADIFVEKLNQFWGLQGLQTHS